METARFLKDDYLQQNSFTKYDKYCPFYKVTLCPSPGYAVSDTDVGPRGMMRALAVLT